MIEFESDTQTNRVRLEWAARRIASNHDKAPASPLYALSKLVIAPRWIGRGVRAPGLRRWKRGELIEVVGALLRRDKAAAREEWGDVGYYVAQSWGWLWRAYVAVTPNDVIEAACRKFEARAATKRVVPVGRRRVISARRGESMLQFPLFGFGDASVSRSPDGCTVYTQRMGIVLRTITYSPSGAYISTVDVNTATKETIMVQLNE
jgi:hypothetical protein